MCKPRHACKHSGHLFATCGEPAHWLQILTPPISAPACPRRRPQVVELRKPYVTCLLRARDGRCSDGRTSPNHHIYCLKPAKLPGDAPAARQLHENVGQWRSRELLVPSSSTAIVDVTTKLGGIRLAHIFASLDLACDQTFLAARRARKLAPLKHLSAASLIWRLTQASPGIYTKRSRSFSSGVSSPSYEALSTCKELPLQPCSSRRHAWS